MSYNNVMTKRKQPVTRILTPTLNDRTAGILIHPTSLPSRFVIGDLGPSSLHFIDFLSKAGLRWWQMLPVGPIGAGDSPYQCYSAFAGNPLLISPELLQRDGLLTPGDLQKRFVSPRGTVDYAHARSFKDLMLRRAHHRFLKSPGTLHRQLIGFRRRESWWLEDYALFNALRIAEGDDWTGWPTDIRRRDPLAMRRVKRELAQDIDFFAFREWIFTSQWSALKRYAAGQGVGLIGDIPIFVSPGSCDVWANPALFQLKNNGDPKVVAGVPPDYFSKTGQRWGNPHYDWNALRRSGYRWWIDRFRQNLKYFDVVRLDHFIGFVRYFEIPGDAPTAERGRYRPGPAADFFRVVLRALQKKGSTSSPFIAEDLGVVTPEVKALRDQFSLPGMKVLQFAFGLDPEAANYQPHAYPQNSVVYTGTHDNDTTLGWFHDKASPSSTRSQKAIREETEFTLRYLNCSGKDISWAMIRAAFASPAHTAIVPMQDFLNLGSSARMNRPGVAEGNWNWRMSPSALTSALSSKIRVLAETYARI